MNKMILVLTANPKNTARLRLDQEVREIENGLQRAQKRDAYILKQRWAVRSTDIRRAMLDLTPNIVHFSGHGDGETGIAFEDENGNAKLVDAEALAGFFKLFANKLECVVLNGCYSEIQAVAISRYINYVIGMKAGISDTAAIEFAVAFYDALGVGDHPIEFAFDVACNAIQLAGVPEYLIPTLLSKQKKMAIQPERSKQNSDSQVSPSNFETSGRDEKNQPYGLDKASEEDNSLSQENRSEPDTFKQLSKRQLDEVSNVSINTDTMIDREDIIKLFHQLLQPNSHFRIISLSGEAKTGKSHLLTKVFPVVAKQQYGYKYAILDLRNRAQNIIEFLHMICGLLGEDSDFPDYYAYYQQWMSRPNNMYAQEGLKDLFSNLSINNPNITDQIRVVLPEMTRSFIRDILRSHHEPLLLLFDSVNEATNDMQLWLLDILLVQLSKIEHLRIVVSGRVLPNPPSTYTTLCQSYQLTPVTTLEAYISYCQKLNIELSEQSIRDFAKAFDYKPGLFVECVVPNFVREGASYG